MGLPRGDRNSGKESVVREIHQTDMEDIGQTLRRRGNKPCDRM